MDVLVYMLVYWLVSICYMHALTYTYAERAVATWSRMAAKLYVTIPARGGRGACNTPVVTVVVRCGLGAGAHTTAN